jgi:hypothetical protein
MNEQVDFFSSKHKQLLDIATWAKYLAWVALVVFFVAAITNPIGKINMFNAEFGTMGQPVMGFIGFLKTFPDEGLKLLFESTSIFMNGIVYYLVLKGISLGLNMIVETDVNYREKENQGGGK